MTPRNAIVARIAYAMREFAPEAETILYGSEARGEARGDSDIDLLVLLPDTYNGINYIRRRGDISGRLYEISLDTGIDISTLILPRKIWKECNTPFKINVTRDGRRL